MKKKYLLFCFIILFLATGCSSNYKLKFDKNMNIHESFIASVKTNDFEFYKNNKEGFDENIKSIQSILNYPIGEYNIKNSNDNTISFDNDYISLDDFNSNSSFLKNVNGKVEQYVNNNNNVIQIIINYDFYYLINTNKYSSLLVNDPKIQIEFPFKIISSNASSVKDNILTWNVSDFRVNQSLYVEYNEESYDDKSVNIIYYVIPIAIISVLLLAFIIYRIYKINKNDKH